MWPLCPPFNAAMQENMIRQFVDRYSTMSPIVYLVVIGLLLLEILLVVVPIVSKVGSLARGTRRGLLCELATHMHSVARVPLPCCTHATGVALNAICVHGHHSNPFDYFVAVPPLRHSTPLPPSLRWTPTARRCTTP
jgi:hypothetical protein